MTCKEKLKMEHPEWVDEGYYGGCYNCPSEYDYLEDPEICPKKNVRMNSEEVCRKCWDREIPNKVKSAIEDGDCTNNEPTSNTPFDIHALIDDAMRKRDRSVVIYIHPENGISVSVYPWPDVDDLWTLYEDGRITANDFRAKMNLPMVKNAEKFMKRSREE